MVVMFSMKRGGFIIKECKNGASSSGDGQITAQFGTPLHSMRGTTISKELNPGIREPDELGYSHLLNESRVYLLPYYIDNNRSNQICDP